ncbi:MAG: DNA double-strand break repair protein Mre11 [Promethearchaeota archaeon]|nr:MAG: DNA double-strand break repair protein Mre11 [Candidatus Lokiarchaeota archaeon]
MRIAHISDTHLGYRQYNLNVREQDIYDAFNQAIDIALEERADVLIHSGDLFDTPQPPIKALYTLKDALGRIGDKMKVLCVLGEHDTPKRRGMAPHRLFDIFGINVLGANYHLEDIVIDDVLFAGISNIRGQASDHLKAELKKFDPMAEKYESAVLILHQALETYLPFEGAFQLKDDELPQNAIYYAMGHIHAREMESFGRGKLAYSGSTEIMNKDEITSWQEKGKGLNLIDIDKGEVEVEQIDLDLRPQKKLTIEVENLEERLKELSFEKKPILHLEIIGKLIDKKSVYETLKDHLEENVVSYRPVFTNTEVKKLQIPKGKIDFAEILRQYYEEEDKAEFALELFETLSIGEVEGAIESAHKRLEGGDFSK